MRSRAGRVFGGTGRGKIPFPLCTCILIAVCLFASGCKEDWSARLGVRPMWRDLAHPFKAYPIEQLEGELAADPPRFSFVVLGDTDLASKDLSQGDETTVFDEIMADVRSMRPEPRFVFHLGDIAANPGDTRAWDAVIRKASPFQVGLDEGAPADAIWKRFLLLPGDRDVNSRRTESDFLERFRRSSGRVPFSFDWKNFHFVALNSETIDDSWLMEYFGYNRKQNRITGTQWTWLQEDFRNNRDKKIVVFIHKPFFPPVFSRHDGYCLDQYYFARERLMDLLSRYSVRVVFSGHAAIFHRVWVRDTCYIITGGAGREPRASRRFGGFYHFLYVTIDEAGGMTVYCVDPERNTVEQKIAVM